MTEARRCPECGTPLIGDSLDGLCPKCVLQQALGDGNGVADSGPGTSPYQPTWFVAPAVEAVTRRKVRMPRTSVSPGSVASPSP